MEKIGDDSAIIKIINGRIKKLPTEGTSTKLPLEKFQQDGYIGNLTDKSVADLEDLLSRQSKILEKKSFISKLNDGGLKIKSRYEDIYDALQKVQSKNHRECELTKAIDHFEWGPHIQKTEENGEAEEQFNSCEMASDPLFLMATHSETVPAKIIQKDEDDDALRIQLDKLSMTDESGLDRSSNPSGIVEDAGLCRANISESYKNKMLIKFGDNAGPEGKRQLFRTNRNSKVAVPGQPTLKKSSLWDESSATGQLKTSSSNPSKMISLQESYDLYQTSKKKIKPAMFYTRPVSTDCYYRDVNATKHVLRPEESDAMFCEND